MKNHKNKSEHHNFLIFYNMFYDLFMIFLMIMLCFFYFFLRNQVKLNHKFHHKKNINSTIKKYKQIISENVPFFSDIVKS